MQLKTSKGGGLPCKFNILSRIDGMLLTLVTKPVIIVWHFVRSDKKIKDIFSPPEFELREYVIFFFPFCFSFSSLLFFFLL